MKLYVFRTVPLSIVRSYSLYTQRWYTTYVVQVCRQLSSRIRMEQRNRGTVRKMYSLISKINLRKKYI
jgi:nucleoside diphosphate kinase